MNDKIIRGVFACALAIVALPASALAQDGRDEIRRMGLGQPNHYRVAIDSSLALKDLLPAPPKNALPDGAAIVQDLEKVPEVHLHEPVRVAGGNGADLEKAKIHTARLTAHINFINKKKTDRFVELLMDNRPDLAGMPFAMGDACRLKAEDRGQFLRAVTLLRMPLGSNWKDYDARRYVRPFHQLEDRFCATVGMQVLAAEPAQVRLGLVERLAGFCETERDKQAAAHALTRLAIFSQEEEVRRAAAAALKKRDWCADMSVLLHGLRYPWPSVAQNAAKLVSQLKRTDLIPELIKMLDEPDPRTPVIQDIKGKKTPVLREVVKINHHRNCLLCHPPANTPDVMTIVPLDTQKTVIVQGVEAIHCNVIVEDEDVLIVTMPTPGLPFPSAAASAEYYPSFRRSTPPPDNIVRADITYLRQDFSLLQKVEDAAPWPEMQRFDYLVRSRALTEAQAAAYQAEFAKRQEPSPYRQAVLASLRSLTDRDAGTSAAAWRDALGMK